MRSVALVAVLAAMVGCKKEAGFAGEGMPPASDWNAEQAGAEVKPMPQPSTGFHGGGTGFHGAAPPQQPRDDEEGEAPNDQFQGTPPDDDTHRGMAQSGESELPQLPPPVEDRPMDPTHRIAGVIKLGAKAKGKAVAGTAVFVVAKHVDAAGQPTGAPLAVAKLIWKDDLAFELTEKNAMIAGTELTGDVIVTAHYDLDAEARTKQPGDILGRVRVKVPAENVKIELDDLQ
jgi:hypothetical protein